MKNQRRQSLSDIFLELAQPDEEGFSRKVMISEFIGKYSVLEMGNGGSWCRDDGGLAKRFNIVRHKSRNKIIAVELQGKKKQPISKRIRADIRNHYKGKACVVLGTSGTECDHKDGRRDDPRLNQVETQELSDFQPLSKPANDVKRQHCKRCRDTGIRFDAKRLGFHISQTKGDQKYNGSCIGCYWYDPIEFKKKIYEGLKFK